MSQNDSNNPSATRPTAARSPAPSKHAPPIGAYRQADALLACTLGHGVGHDAVDTDRRERQRRRRQVAKVVAMSQLLRISPTGVDGFCLKVRS